MQGKYDGYAFTNSLGQPTLNYTICSYRNIKTLHSALSDKPSQDDLKKSDSEVITSLLTEPVWQLAPRDKKQLVDKSIVNLTENVTSLGFLKQGMTQ